MSTRIQALCVLLILVATAAVAGNATVESETIIRYAQRRVGRETDVLVFPLYEYLTLDADGLGMELLSLHVYGWGRYDAADSGYHDKRVDAELIFAYLEYADTFQRRNARLGRQLILEGVANETIDGIWATSDLGQYLSVSAYGGLPVGLEDVAGRSGDIIWGGRGALHLGSIADVGVSYKTMDNDGATAASRLGFDSALYLPWNIRLYGNSVRNEETKGWAEHSYEAVVDVGDISVRPSFELFQYADYFQGASSFVGPFRFLALTDEELQAVGVDLSWRRSESWSFGGRAKQFSYALRDASMYVSASIDWSGEAATQVGGEVGYMQGEAADNNYVLVRLFCFRDQLAHTAWVDFLSSDVFVTLYDEDIYGENRAYSLSVSSGKQFLNDDLELKLSAEYSSDPYFDSDLRAMLTMTYRFSVGY